MNGNERKILGGCLMVGLLILVACIFPLLLFILIPYCFYLYFKQQKEKEQLHNMIEQELLGLDKEGVERKRQFYIIISQSSNASEAEKETAKYIVRYIEKKCWK